MRQASIYILISAVAIGALWWALPIVDDAQPRGIHVTREQAREIADQAARQHGIEVDDAWVVTYWATSPFLEERLAEEGSREDAERDPFLAPRLGGFATQYYRLGQEKNPPYGYVIVGRDGKVQELRRFERGEVPGARPEAEDLRPIADALVASREFAGTNELEFQSVHPTVHRDRADHRIRYRTMTDFPLENVSYFLDVHFVGDEPAGWTLAEESIDGSVFQTGFGDQIVGTFLRYVVLGVLFIALMLIFLRKYHAGEVGVVTGGYLFVLFVALSIAGSFMSAAQESVGTQFGPLDAPRTALAMGGFRFLFFELPVAILLFVGWSVGESYARERWGHRLASFDSLLHRDPLNATAGKALLVGIVLSPLVAAAELVPAALLVLADVASPALGQGTYSILYTGGGAFTHLTYAIAFSLIVGVVAIMFLLSSLRRFRSVWFGVALASLTGVMIGINVSPVRPEIPQVLLSIGSVLVGCLIFLAVDLLSSVTALLLGWMLIGMLPYIRAAEGAALNGPVLALVIPFGLAALVGVAGALTRREVSYEYEDLAPHVRRIIERERVKAEIDAANRIQAALLPDGEPEIAGVSVASHYRAATEIGGDYFDFLQMKNGQVGIAFGDVAGHGLTSGIVMAMAKSALLVQLEYESAPKKVMEVMNDVVIRTGPSRMLMTFFFGLLDPASRKLVFSSAGHLDPYVFRRRSGELEELSAWGYPLGIRRRRPFPEIEVEFFPGDRLILYSDGLIEALNDDGEPFGFDRFEKTLMSASERSAEEIRRALLDAVRKFTKNRPPDDDQTLVVISFDGLPSVHELSTAEQVAV